jgi:hypothetical protein
MRKAINAAFGGDLIRGSWRSACSRRVRFCFRYASARGMASSEPGGPYQGVGARPNPRGPGLLTP